MDGRLGWRTQSFIKDRILRNETLCLDFYHEKILLFHESLRPDSGRPRDGATVVHINPAVMSIDRNGQAARFVCPGAIILNVNGVAIETAKALQKAINGGIGRGWQIILSRDGEVQRILVR